MTLPTPRRRRRLARVLAFLGALAAIVVLLLANRLGFMLAGYKAKMLCSQVFLAGRPADTVVRDLEVDDLWVLRALPASVSTADRTAAAGFPFGLRTRHARYVDGRGCTLEYGDRISRAPLSTSDTGRPHPDAPAPVSAALKAAVDAAFDEPDPARPRRTRAVVVLHDGQVVAEHYADGFDRRTPLPGWSMSKTALNALVGILVAQGRLSTDAAAPLAEWQSAGDGRGRITLDQLLRMTSGLRFDERMTAPFSDVLHMLFEAPDMAAFALRAPLGDPPGTTWRYASGSSVIVSAIIRRTLGNDDEYARFPQQALFAPLGMASAVMEADAAGTFVASSYMFATARDWATLGQLYLQDGIWNGARLLPAGWVEYSRTPTAADPARAFGAHVWAKLPDDYAASHTPLPADSFHAAGHEGQFVSIVPSRRLVVVRLGRTRHDRAWDQSRFVADVLDAMSRR